MTARVLAPPTSVGRTIALGGGTQLAARGFDLGVNVVVSVAMTRALGPGTFGDYVLVSAVVGFVGLGSELGLPKLAVREISREPLDDGVIVGTVMAIRAVLSVAALAVAQLVVLAFGAGSTVRVATLVASAIFFADTALTVVVLFQAHLAQHLEAAARTVASAVKLVLVLVLVQVGAGLVPLMAAPVAGVAAAALVAHGLAPRVRRSDLAVATDQVRHLVRCALPVAPAVLVGVLYLKLDAGMVALLRPRHDLGVYGAAYVPIEYLFLASAVLIQLLFPLLAQSVGDHQLFVDRYRFALDVLVGAFGFIAATLVCFARPTVVTAFGEPYAGASTPLAILAVALVLLVVNGWQGSALLAVDQQIRNLRYLGVAVAANVVLDLVLIPWTGIVGAAIGTLVSAAGLVVASSVGVTRSSGAAPDAISTVALLAAAVVAGSAMAAANWFVPPVAALAVGGAVWLLIVRLSAGSAIERARRVLLTTRAASVAVQP